MLQSIHENNYSVLSYQPTTALPTLAPNANRTSIGAPTAATIATATTISDLNAGTITTTTTTIENPTKTAALSPEVPKSPPRWPLRPGVMVHVRNDTKQNLAANRMTLLPRAPSQNRVDQANQANNTLTSIASSNVNNATPSTAQTTLTQTPTQTPNQQTQAHIALMTTPPHNPPTYTATLGRIPRNTKHNTTTAGLGSPTVLVTGFQSLPRHSSMCARIEPYNVLLTDDCLTPQQLSAAIAEELQERHLAAAAAVPATPPPPPTSPPTLPKRNSRPRLVIGGASPTAAARLTNAGDLSAHSASELLPRTLRPQIVAATAAAQTDDIVDVATAAAPEEAASSLQETAQAKCQNDAKVLQRVQRAVTHFFTRRSQQRNDSSVGGVEGDGMRDSQRSHVGLLGAVARSFWRSKAAQNEFGVEHRLKGIRCSGSGK